jgi:hypothetical protein
MHNHDLELVFRQYLSARIEDRERSSEQRKVLTQSACTRQVYMDPSDLSGRTFPFQHRHPYRDSWRSGISPWLSMTFLLWISFPVFAIFSVTVSKDGKEGPQTKTSCEGLLITNLFAVRQPPCNFCAGRLHCDLGGDIRDSMFFPKTRLIAPEHPPQVILTL